MMDEKFDYDLICKRCIDLFEMAGAAIPTSEKVNGGRCWRCLCMASKDNPVYRLLLPTSEGQS